MKRLLWRGLAVSLAFIGIACHHEAEISVELPDSFEGKQIDLVSFCDSTVLSSATVENGKVHFSFSENDSIQFPLLSQLMIEGRARGFYVIEPGRATLDSTRRVYGTPLNGKMARLLARMDSADARGMYAYIDEAEKIYNENKDNVLASYFGIEWMKYAEPGRVDSLLRTSPGDWSTSRRADYYINFAKLRAATSPGRHYADFAGDDADGNPVNFSRFIVPGHYTLVDFMASWCPYCIKDFPEVARVYNEYHDRGLNVVSVAVRDKPEDTAAAVRRHGLVWEVMYNTQKVPYDIYGFSGIPHYMLISPDGTIVVRGETFATIEDAVRSVYAPEEGRE